MRRVLGVIATIAGLMVAVNLCHAESDKGKGIEGTWGGDSLRMEVTAGGATFDFGCASGEVLEPVKLDAQGKFRVKGMYQRQGPGPSRGPEQDKPNATYSGEVKGKTMRLEVDVNGKTQAYSLEQGRATKILGCK